jgi:hypothetical protein
MHQEKADHQNEAKVLPAEDSEPQEMWKPVVGRKKDKKAGYSMWCRTGAD